jgi:hypothetical protein
LIAVPQFSFIITKMPNIQLQFRRDTSTNWTANNPVLASGEMGLETDTRQFKIGTGVLGWRNLPYGGIQGAAGPAGGLTFSGPTGSVLYYNGGVTGTSDLQWNVFASSVLSEAKFNNGIQFNDGFGSMGMGPGGTTGNLTLQAGNKLILIGDTTLQAAIGISGGTANYGTTGQFLGSDGVGNVVWKTPSGFTFSAPTGSVLISDGSSITGTTGLRWDSPTSILDEGLFGNGIQFTDISGHMSVGTGGATADLTISARNNVLLLGDVGLKAGIGYTGQSRNYGTTGDFLGSDGVGNVVWKAPNLAFSNTLFVDGVKGIDSSASAGGSPYKTVDAAVTAATSGQLVWVMPGVYNLTAGLTLSDGVSIRGASVQATTIQLQSVTADTTLITLVGNNRVEDVTLNLQSTGHNTLKGILFTGQSTKTSKIRTSVITVDNSTAGSAGTSEVYGVEAGGTGVFADIQNFSFNSLKGSTITVKSDGQGNKRGIYVSSSNSISTRDMNIFVAQPTSPTTATGAYIGVETRDAINFIGSIQLRSTTIGTVKKSAGHVYSVADILQVYPTNIPDPTYLATPGIQVGPGVDLVTKSAGGTPFSTYTYPTTIYYGLKGNITSGPGGYLWPGTQSVSAGTFPDPGLPAAYYRVQQPSILCGINAAAAIGPTDSQSTTIQVYYTPISTGLMVPIPNFRATLIGLGAVSVSYYGSSQDLNVGDRIHVGVTYSGNNSNNTTHDLTIQLDMF